MIYKCVCVCVARSSLLHTYWVYVATDGHRDVNQFAVKLTDWAMGARRTGGEGRLGKNNASVLPCTVHSRKVIEFDQQIILAVHSRDIHTVKHKCR